MLCYQRDDSSTDGLSPRCLSREIVFDVMAKTDKSPVEPVWWFLVFGEVHYIHFVILYRSLLFCFGDVVWWSVMFVERALWWFMVFVFVFLSLLLLIAFVWFWQSQTELLVVFNVSSKVFLEVEIGDINLFVGLWPVGSASLVVCDAFRDNLAVTDDDVVLCYCCWVVC